MTHIPCYRIRRDDHESIYTRAEGAVAAGAFERAGQPSRGLLALQQRQAGPFPRRDRLGAAQRGEVQSDWDGLTLGYAALWQTAEQPDEQYHGRWLLVLGCGVVAA